MSILSPKINVSCKYNITGVLRQLGILIWLPILKSRNGLKESRVKFLTMKNVMAKGPVKWDGCIVPIQAKEINFKNY